ncbi:MAG: glycosyltransferase [Candidatus Dormibacteraeota bacterium]|nr:glycosyltransferase [Candidatus Dormibacteraeota bacterium]
MARAFPGAPLYTSLYSPAGTFAFAGVDVRPSPLNLVAALRRDHRLALPLLAAAFSMTRLDAPVTLVSSSGWAHGVRVTGRKIVYCHNPARWLYQRDRYLGSQQGAARAAMRILGPPLQRWDRRSARSANRYLCNSTATRRRIRECYGIDAEVLHPPPALDPLGPYEPIAGVEPGFVLCVSRLLPYKNVDAVIAAAEAIAGPRLVVAGEGPERRRLQAAASDKVHFAGRVDDAQLRWLYANCTGLVAASHEDFGLTPLEAATFGRPVAALRGGGYLDTVSEGNTGVFFDAPRPMEIAAAVREMLGRAWDADMITERAAAFSEPRFAARLREVVDEEAAAA